MNQLALSDKKLPHEVIEIALLDPTRKYRSIEKELEHRTSVYHQYVIESPERDSLKKFLNSRGIGTGLYYPQPLHQHEAWKARNLPAYSLPEAERYSRENLAIPVFAELEDEEVAYIISTVREYFASRS